MPYREAPLRADRAGLRQRQRPRRRDNRRAWHRARRRPRPPDSAHPPLPVWRPRATSGWFVTPIARNPAARASDEGGNLRRDPKLGNRVWGYGSPSCTTASFSTPSRSKKTARAAVSPHGFPFRFVRLENRVRNQKVPRSETPRCVGDPFRADCGHQDARVRHARRIAAVPTDDADNPGASGLRDIKRSDEVGARSSTFPHPRTARAPHRGSSDRLVRSHAANTVAQPSSLVRAVSSDTLSVGA